MPVLTRRRVLAGAGVIGAGVVGAVVGLLRPAARTERDVTTRPTPTAPPVPPAALLSALAREQQLIARLSASAGAGAAASLAALTADHRAHRDALISLLRPYRTEGAGSGGAASGSTLPSGAGSAPSSGAPSSGAPSSGAPSSNATSPPLASLATLRSHESTAARLAAAESAALTGTAATVLASIAACEAGHAVLLDGAG